MRVVVELGEDRRPPVLCGDAAVEPLSRAKKRRGWRQKVLERGPTIPGKWTPAWK
jgi:hypothetical protein